MENLGVMLMQPKMPYLEEQLSDKFPRFYRYSDVPDDDQKQAFLSTNAPSVHAIVVNMFSPVNAGLINALPNLQIVSSFSVGLDHVDLPKCKERGIRVTNTPDVLTDDAADLAIGLILSVLRRICQSDGYVRKGLWKTKGDFRLTTKFTGKRVGIVGLGRIGLAIAKRAEAFDCPISYNSKSKKADITYKYCEDVVDLAANCDILVLACPLTKETYHIVNQPVIDALGPNGVLVNIGRGPLVDEPELVKALLEKRLGGAGLDVFEHEPEPPTELFDLENVVLLPHVGSATIETRQDMADLVVKNLEAHALKKPLITPVV